MAKKKTNKKKEGGLPEHFVGHAIALVLGAIALLLLLALFGFGGALPKALLDMNRWLFGGAVLILPFILSYVVVEIFKSDHDDVPKSLFAGAGILTILIGALVHLFADNTSQFSEISEGGGLFGWLISGLALVPLLTKLIAGIILVVCITIALAYLLNVTVKQFLHPLLGRFNKSSGSSKEPSKNDDKKVDADEDEQNEATMKAAKGFNKKAFKMREGVPVKAGLADAVIPKKKQVEDQEALTTASDPNWEFPSLELLSNKQDKADAGDVKGNAEIIQDTLGDFGVSVEMESANIGPRVTQYELKPSSGVRLTKITSLENNIALNLAAESIRIEAPIPGKKAVGIEVPNRKGANVMMRSILEENAWKVSSGELPFVIGRDIAGEPTVVDLAEMPHLLIAGATGSGKSVMINTLLTSLLYKNTPSDLRLILVDPKQVELTPYNDIPHLLTPVITSPEQTLSALKWAVAEMERRYKVLADAGTRNIVGYNKKSDGEEMPYIVVVIDELADLMMAAARDVEALIVRIAQKARAVGIHLVLATQRPSVDVITGLIKANIPARIAFTVTSQIDSRTIIDGGGAEKLLGKGDMLLSTPRYPKPKRIQAAFIDDPEAQKVTDFIRAQRQPEYNDEIIAQPVQIGNRPGFGSPMGGDDAQDSMYEEAVRCVIEGGKASSSLLQRRLRVGYARAARLIETMEEQGVVGPADGSRPREVLVSSMDDVFGEGGDDDSGDDSEL